MIRKIKVLLRLGKLRLMLLMALISFIGATYSPNFYSDLFPKTFLSSLLSIPPTHTSILHAFGASLVSMLIWFGTALFNDYFDIEIDKRINPYRPLVKGEISPKEVKFWASLSYAIAFLIAVIEGDLLCTLIACIFIFLGFQYSAPPLRLRRWGLCGSLIIGVGIFGAFLGGCVAQFYVTSKALIAATLLGLLATTASSVKDYKDIEGDKEVGIKTLPIVYGYEQSIRINVLALSVSYALVLAPFLVGYFNIYLSLIIFIIALFNLKFFHDLKKRRDLESRRKTYFRCLTCYFMVVIVFAVANVS